MTKLAIPYATGKRRMTEYGPIPVFGSILVNREKFDRLKALGLSTREAAIAAAFDKDAATKALSA